MSKSEKRHMGVLAVRFAVLFFVALFVQKFFAFRHVKLRFVIINCAKKTPFGSADFAE